MQSTSRASLIGKIVAVPGYSLWLGGWLSLLVVVVIGLLQLTGHTGNVITIPANNQPLFTIKVERISLPDTVLLTVFNLLTWFGISRLGAWFARKASGLIGVPQSTVKYAGLGAAWIPLTAASFIIWTTPAALIIGGLALLIGSLSFWLEQRVA